jgi:uncharacterized protein with ATP-grasp and redox domains
LRTYLDCFPCFLRQALAAARVATDDPELQRRVLDAVAALMPQLPLDASPPEIAQKTYRLVHEITGNNDPFKELKRIANQHALELYPRFKEAVAAADDPLLSACKLAIAGNAIDLGPPSGHTHVDGIPGSALCPPLVIDDYAAFRRSIHSSDRVLYLGDNAGEIVFDRILVEELRKVGDFEVTFVVRKSPIINDATLDDALYAGIDSVARIMSNGSDAPATILSQCSPEMLRLYASADTIIAKGQGNYESLSDEHGNIFFLLKAKCQLVAGHLGVNEGDAILLHNRDTGP